jgi:hypothetical protein
LAGDLVTPKEEIKDPFVLEFLGLKDEYSEADVRLASTCLWFRCQLFRLPVGTIRYLQPPS